MYKKQLDVISKGKDKILAIDVDGVILDYNKSFTKYFYKMTGYSIKYNPDSWNFDLTSEEDLKELRTRIDEFANKGKILELLDENWAKYLNELRKNFYVVIITAWPNEETRKKNLEYHKIEYDEIYFTDYNNKPDIMKKINPDYIFEDSPNNVNKMTEIFKNSKFFVPGMWNYSKNGISIVDENKHQIIFYDELDKIMKDHFNIFINETKEIK